MGGRSLSLVFLAFILGLQIQLSLNGFRRFRQISHGAINRSAAGSTLQTKWIGMLVWRFSLRRRRNTTRSEPRH